MALYYIYVYMLNFSTLLLKDVNDTEEQQKQMMGEALDILFAPDMRAYDQYFSII